MKNNKRFVLDTNLFISSLLSRTSPPAAVFDFIQLYGQFLFSKETFQEVCEVLYRPKFDRYLSTKRRDELITELLDIAVFVTPQKKFSLCRDPKDNMFLDVAVEGKADFIVSGDDDLLVLEKIENTAIVNAKTLEQMIISKQI